MAQFIFRQAFAFGLLRYARVAGATNRELLSVSPIGREDFPHQTQAVDQSRETAKDRLD
jgi:hypothetical protein